MRFPFLQPFSFSQTLSPSLLSPESSFTATPPIPERSEGSEVKGQGQPDARRQDHCFLLKRKRRRTEEDVEDAGLGRSSQHKRICSGELLKDANCEANTNTRQHWCLMDCLTLPLEPSDVTDSLSSVVGGILDATDLECSLCMR